MEASGTSNSLLEWLFECGRPDLDGDPPRVRIFTVSSRQHHQYELSPPVGADRVPGQHAALHVELLSTVAAASARNAPVMITRVTYPAMWRLSARPRGARGLR